MIPTETNRKSSAVYNTSVASLGSLKRQNNNTGASTAFTNYACSVNDTDEIQIHGKATKATTSGSPPATQVPTLSKEITVSFKNESAKSEHFSTASAHPPSTKGVCTSFDSVLTNPTYILASGTQEISGRTDWPGCPSSGLSNLNNVVNQEIRNQQLASNNKHFESDKTARLEKSYFEGPIKQIRMSDECKGERVESGECPTNVRVSIVDAENVTVDIYTGKFYFETPNKKMETTDACDTRL